MCLKNKIRFLIQLQIINEQVKPRLKYLAITINQDESTTLKELINKLNEHLKHPIKAF